MIPSFFIAHGSPLLAVEDNAYTTFLYKLSDTIKKPIAIIIFSAHWESDIQKVGNSVEYDMIYDFSGFPEELYRIKYPAVGNEAIFKEIQQLLHRKGIPFEVDAERGLDHGAWVVLRLIYSEANIPVISMSVSPHTLPKDQYEIGKALSSLREKDVLIIASGGTVHNLGALNWEKDNIGVDDWAIKFDQWLASCLEKWDLESLYNYHSLEPTAKYAVPLYGVEHFIPIFYAMGAADDKKIARLLHRSYRYGNLSHSIWQFG